MVVSPQSKAAALRAQLGHPIIDSDGHVVELGPLFLEHFREFAGEDLAKRYTTTRDPLRWFKASEQEKRDSWIRVPPWWGLPTKLAVDRATASMPRLLYDRMEELGMDYSVIYPTLGLEFPRISDDELRQATCRAVNVFNREMFSGLEDRLTVAAAIPMYTPEEAVKELEFAVRELGFKVIMLDSHVRRPTGSPAAASDAELGPDRLDFFAIDSEYDYDPVWAKCSELKVVPTFHYGSMGWGSRRSISNYMFNHIGHFAASGEAICKAVFFGGVTRRFPELRFAFLEGGVGWACSLFADIVGHWQKRNPKAMENYNPANLDLERVMGYLEQYGGDRLHKNVEAVRRGYSSYTVRPEELDDWAACNVEKEQDLYDLFVPKFFFGCEADDAMNSLAFNTKLNPMGARLGAVLSSDVGHWDVPDMREVVPEAYELVEKGLMSTDDFREFSFGNAVRLWSEMNPNFFDGTAVETEARKAIDKQAT